MKQPVDKSKSDSEDRSHRSQRSQRSQRSEDHSHSDSTSSPSRRKRPPLVGRSSLKLGGDISYLSDFKGRSKEKTAIVESGVSIAMYHATSGLRGELTQSRAHQCTEECRFMGKELRESRLLRAFSRNSLPINVHISVLCLHTRLRTLPTPTTIRRAAAATHPTAAPGPRSTPRSQSHRSRHRRRNNSKSVPSAERCMVARWLLPDI